MALKKGRMADRVSVCLQSPLRVSGVYFRIHLLVQHGESAAEPQLVISVPKRWVKRAIDRNTVKRLGREWWTGFVDQTLPSVPGMAFVQISPKMLEACREKAQGTLSHSLWKQRLAGEFQGLGGKLHSRWMRQLSRPEETPESAC